LALTLTFFLPTVENRKAVFAFEYCSEMFLL
jgi:hypothetical protein